MVMGSINLQEDETPVTQRRNQSKIKAIKSKKEKVWMFFSPALVGQNGAGRRLPLAMLGSQGRQRPLLQMQRTPGPAFTQPSSAKKAWQLGGR